MQIELIDSVETTELTVAEIIEITAEELGQVGGGAAFVLV